jgi:hypothetical protein
LSQFVGETDLTAEQVVATRIEKVLVNYLAACAGNSLLPVL